MLEIKLSQGKVAIVDEQFYAPLLELGRWNACEKDNLFYALCSWERGTGRTLSMHREVIRLSGIDITGIQIDHKDRNGLHNWIKNLRVATPSQNTHNRGKMRSNTSGYIGVYWRPDCNLWHCCIRNNNKKVHIGYFKSLIEAAIAYDKKCVELHGEFAVTNFPISNYGGYSVAGSTTECESVSSGSSPLIHPIHK